MNELIALIVGVLIGAVGAVIYYRRNIAKVEKSLVDAVTARKAIEEAFEALKTKIGG